jgi:hypothetical protein
MKLSPGAWLSPRNRNLRHNFLISAFADSPIAAGRARVYYCVRCQWNFLVCENRIAPLDKSGDPIGGEEGFDRFKTFGDGPCPALAQLDPAAPRAADTKTIP